MSKYLSSLCLLLTACAANPSAVPADAQTIAAIAKSESAETTSPAQRFMRWKHEFMSRAASQGYDQALLERTIGRAEFQTKAVSDNANQAEFVKPIWDYVQNAASETRIQTGQTKLAQQDSLFDQIESRYQIDRHILTAIWGMESAYGKVQGSYNPIDVLASFAFEGRRSQFGETQLFALLDLLQAGYIQPEQLKSSWAGAMGMTQFIPATFRDYAIDFDKDGDKDLWQSEADALGSAANYLSRHGWRAAEPVFAEVRLPDGFDYSLSDGESRFIMLWQNLGIVPYHGGTFTQAAAMLEAKLYIPAGHKGPALLIFKNFDVIKRYNNSNSYAMGIATLARNLSGRAGILAPWPEGDTQITRSQKKKLQQALTKLGFDTGGIDGAIGPMSMRAIRAWQQANGYPADGYVEASLYATIAKQASMTP